jgi:hypothetical protein
VPPESGVFGLQVPHVLQQHHVRGRERPETIGAAGANVTLSPLSSVA